MASVGVAGMFFFGPYGWIVIVLALLLDLSIFFLLRMWHKRKNRTQGMPENKIQNNADLVILNQAYQEVVNSYSHLKKFPFLYFIPVCDWRSDRSGHRRTVNPIHIAWVKSRSSSISINFF
ncbi:MAG: hypothetical protein ACFFAS_02370 [Promethearchaeota archaeon]